MNFQTYFEVHIRMKPFNFRKDTELAGSADRIRRLKDYYRHTSFGERLYVKLVSIVMLIVVAVLCTGFFMSRFNSYMHANDRDLELTLDTVNQRYTLSNLLLDSQEAYLVSSVKTEAELERLYLNNTPRGEWISAVNLLTDKDDNVEFYYYEGYDEVIKSSNADGIGLDSDELQQLIDDGIYKHNGSTADLYAAVPIYNGTLIAMYRDIGNFTAVDMRDVFSSTQITGESKLIIYNTETGNIYSPESEHWSDRSINDLDTKEIFDNARETDYGDYSFRDLIRSLNTYRTSSITVNDNIRITAYYSVRDCFLNAASDAVLPLINFLLVAVVLAGGAASMRIMRYPVRNRSELIHLFKNVYLDKQLIKRTASMLVISTAVIAATMSYVSALTDISRENIEAEVNLDDIRSDEVFSMDTADNYEEIRNSNLSSLLDKAVRIINSSEALRSNEMLSEISEIIPKCKDITIYNSDGISIASSDGFTGYALGDAEQGSTDSSIKQLLSSNRISLLTDPDDDYVSSYAAKTKFNSGLVRFNVVNDEFRSVIERLRSSSILIEADFGNASVLYYNEPESSVLFAAFAGFHTTKTILNTISPDALHDNYFGSASLDGSMYFINVAADNTLSGNYFISAWPVSELIDNICSILLFFIKCCILIFVILLILFVPVRVKPENMINIPAVGNADNDGENRIHPDEASNVSKDKLRLYKNSIDILERDFGISVQIIIRGCILAFIAYLMFGLFTGNKTGSLIQYLFNSNWERGVNIFSFTLILIIVLCVWIISIVLQKLTATISENTGPAGITIGKLIISLIKFASLIVIILLVLTELGVQTGSILAGAGLTSVVIGIGAQSTVNNILAGLFIIFEGHFRVGDIVKIDGWTGMIKEIGVRTTCIESYGLFTDYKNLRVINNSDFTDVINLSRSRSQAIAVLSVPYDTDMSRISEIFVKNKEAIMNAMPEIIDGPFFDGIVEYGSSAKLIRFRVVCNEADRTYLERILMQTVGDLLEKHGITAPYDQVVIHTEK